MTRPATAPDGHLVCGLLFFFSGATALVYEVTWVRLFSVLFGNSTYAISTILAVFMGGLAVGSYLFGRWIDRVRRPLQVYGLVEIAIAATAFCVPHALGWAEPAIAAVYREVAPPLVQLTLIRVGLAVTILLVPTVLMGATLPILSRCFIQGLHHVGDRVGFLYGINTLGAVLGCALTGFVLIPHIGVTASCYLACGVNVLIGGAALQLSRSVPATPVAPTPERPETRTHPGARPGVMTTAVLLTFFISGFTSLSYEVLWTRILSFVFRKGMSSYAFTLMLSLFLLGLALGSLLYSRWLSSHRRPIRLVAFLQMLIGASVLFCVLLVSAGNSSVGRASLFEHVLQSGLIVFPPTVLMGMVFPLACQLITGSLSSLGASLGRAYALNTIGSVLGPMVTGFLLVPVLGTETTLKAIVAANLLLGAMFLLLQPGRRRLSDSLLAISVPCLAIVFLAIRSQMVLELMNPERETVLVFKEGPATTVLATRGGEGVKLNVGGTVGAGTLRRFRGTTELLAYGPMLLHPDPRHVAVVGFGTGRTASFFVRRPGIERVDVVDISRSVFEVGREFFGSYNGDVLSDPKTRAVLDDGFNFLKYTESRYDIVSLDPFTPHTPGSARLYSRDCLEQARSRLKPGGIVILWALPRWARWKSFATALTTFHAVFPHSTVWFTPDREYLVFLGTSAELELDVANVNERLAARPELPGSESYVLRNAYDFLRCFFLGESAVRRIVALERLPLFTVENPVLEFLIHTDTSPPIRKEWIRQNRSAVLPYLKNVPEEISERLRAIPGSETAEESNPDWIDRQGRFTWVGEEAVFRFGRHEGRSLREVLEIDPQYLHWIGTAAFSEDVKRLVRDTLEGRLPERDERP